MTTTSRPRNRREAAAYLTEIHHLKTSPKYLAKLASVGGGPRYRLYGGRSGYDDHDLDEYAASKISKPRGSTSEAAA